MIKMIEALKYFLSCGGSLWMPRVPHPGSLVLESRGQRCSLSELAWGDSESAAALQGCPEYWGRLEDQPHVAETLHAPRSVWLSPPCHLDLGSHAPSWERLSSDPLMPSPRLPLPLPLCPCVVLYFCVENHGLCTARLNPASSSVPAE